MPKNLINLKQVTNSIFSHIECYLNQLVESDYCKPLELLSSASIGGHTRHIIDGFLCLMLQHSTNTICYDSRVRDEKIATDNLFALQKISEIKLFLSQIEVGGSCLFESKFLENLIVSDSSIEREMVHNIEHAIHHLAIIKIALKYYFPQIEIPKDFGVAFSTLQYWETTKMES
jgi:hypothetical protein